MGSCKLLDINIYFSHGHRSVQFIGCMPLDLFLQRIVQLEFLVAIVLIVRARATERKAPFKLLQLASLIIFSSMVIIVVGIMFIPFTGMFLSFSPTKMLVTLSC